MGSFNLNIYNDLIYFIFSKKNILIKKSQTNLITKNNELRKKHSEGIYYQGEAIKTASTIPITCHPDLVDEFHRVIELLKVHSRNKHLICSYIRNALNYADNIDEIYRILPSSVYSELPGRVTEENPRDVSKFIEKNVDNNILLNKMLMANLLIGD
jgi:hypothetical protein